MSTGWTLRLIIGDAELVDTPYPDEKSVRAASCERETGIRTLGLGVQSSDARMGCSTLWNLGVDDYGHDLRLLGFLPLYRPS
jgi:hypothetical protein